MSSIVLSSDTLKAPPSIGEIEYNGKILTATPQANTQRGIIPTEQFFRLNTDLVGANVTTAQSLFGVGVTLAAGTAYEFEIVCSLSKTAGTTSHTISNSFSGAAAFNMTYQSLFRNGAATTNIEHKFVTSTTSNVLTGAITSAAFTIYGTIKGIVKTSTGGSFIPRYILSAAPGGAYTVQAGSFMKIKPIGTDNGNTVVGTWA